MLLVAGYSADRWAQVGEAYAALVNDQDAEPVRGLYDDAHPQGPGTDNSYAMYLATVCTDARWPQSWPRILRDNRRTHRVAPFETWGNAWFNGPCRTWPAAGRPRVTVTGSEVASPVLLVGETLDAATPYPGALEVRRRFPTASLVEGVGGTTHASSLAAGPCVADAIGAYLADGTVPPRTPGRHSDLQCPPVPRPDPSALAARRPSTRTGADGALRDLLRRSLAAAVGR